MGKASNINPGYKPRISTKTKDQPSMCGELTNQYRCAPKKASAPSQPHSYKNTKSGKVDTPMFGSGNFAAQK